MFGKLGLEYLPHDPIIMAAGGLMGVVALVVIGLITYLKRWGWLWREWLTTSDHKKIGIMYILVAILMLMRGAADALMMRTQLTMNAFGIDFIDADHYAQLFSAHGVIMIFFMAMPLIFGFFNLLVPIQIGARDVAYPFLNAVSFWLFVAGAMLVNVSLVLGKFATAGWLAYPPLSGSVYSPGVGMDYYIWSIQISGIGSLLTGVNFFATIMKMRTKGMTLFRMPVFVWSVLGAVILVMMVFPVLTVTLAMLTFDRYLGSHFFTPELGGSAMLYINMIWVWGHPEVYILVLPAFGILSEVVSTFSKKKLFGYHSMVWALMAITVLSGLVWVHHFFTMGSGPLVNAVFGIATMLISIPTGVKVFNWLATMYKGRVTLASPMFWLIAFLITFVIGGMTGVMLAIPAADFQYHNSLFLVAHFHNTIVGGVVFGLFAGISYWFPKYCGFKLNETLGKIATCLWVLGFFVAFMPTYLLGLMGATRRVFQYTNPDWTIFVVVSMIGTLILALAGATQVIQLLWAIINHKKNPAGRDPWGGRTLEWSLPSPIPFYNFAHLPEVKSVDDFWYKKQAGIKEEQKPYEDIHMPKGSGIPVVVGALSFIFGFSLVFHIFWLAGVMFVAMLVLLFAKSFDYDIDYYVSAKEVEEIEEGYKRWEETQKRGQADVK